MLRKGVLLSLLRTSSGLGIRLCRILPRIGASGGTPCRGVRVLVFFAFAGLFVCLPAVLAFSCFLIGLLAFPLCGGAPTFLCRPQRKVGAPRTGGDRKSVV